MYQKKDVLNSGGGGKKSSIKMFSRSEDQPSIAKSVERLLGGDAIIVVNCPVKELEPVCYTCQIKPALCFHSYSRGAEK
jgi:hypothetical protein